jgi:hypothetical protein
MAKPLSAREAFELHKSAVTRDFIAKPRLGNIVCNIKLETLLKKVNRLPHCHWSKRSFSYS